MTPKLQWDQEVTEPNTGMPTTLQPIIRFALHTRRSNLGIHQAIIVGNWVEFEEASNASWRSI